MSVTPEVRELAAKTAAGIRQFGWITGRMAVYRDDQLCGVCAVGGAALADRGNPEALDVSDSNGEWAQPTGLVADLLDEIISRVYPHLAGDRGGLVYDVTHWNDSCEAADEVLAVLDSIAA